MRGIGDEAASAFGQSRRRFVSRPLIGQADMLDASLEPLHFIPQRGILINLGFNLLVLFRRKGAEQIAEQMFA